MAWSRAASIAGAKASAEARRQHSAAKHSVKMQMRQPGGHPYIGTVMDSAKVAKSNRAYLAKQIKATRSGSQSNRYSLMEAAVVSTTIRNRARYDQKMKAAYTFSKTGRR